MKNTNEMTAVKGVMIADFTKGILMSDFAKGMLLSDAHANRGVMIAD